MSTSKVKEEENDNDNENENENENENSCDDVEPKLKYERMGNDMQNILRKDSVNCVAFHPKIICIGTRWGVVHLLDHQGNIIQNEQLKAHTVAVNEISLDTKGDYVASCSDDGKVYVYGLHTSDNSLDLSLGRSIKSIAIDPNYYRLGTNRRVITGDDRLVLHEKTFLSRIKSTVLYDAVGRVQNINWKGRFVAWTCDVGVRVYDILSRCSLVLIKWNRTENVIPENYRCCLCWKDSVTLLIGWVDTVRVCKIQKRNSVIKDIPELVVNPVCTFQIDYFICGLGPLDKCQLVILGYSKDKSENGKSLRPQMYILQSDEDRYVEVYTDNLSLRGFEEYVCNDYRLECLVEENRYIIASPRDVVIASTYDYDDRIDWLVGHNKFEEAMQLIEAQCKLLTRNCLLTVGKKYLDYLLNKKEYEKAGYICWKVLGNNKEAWEEEVFKFARVHELRSISEYLPTDKRHLLHAHIYEMVLYEYLKMQPQGFVKMIKKWSNNNNNGNMMYNVHAVINAVLEHLVKNVVTANEKNVLLEAMAILYSHCGQYDKAVSMYLKLKNKDVFALVEKYKLYANIHDMIEDMMQLDANGAINMFLNNLDDIPVQLVTEKLKNNQYYLYLYLDALDGNNKKDKKTKGMVSAKAYHGLLVKLYANFATDKLLALLKRSDNYPIQEALDICKERNLYAEMVYLLGRIGNTAEALEIVIKNIGDMEGAISFCKEHDDQDLWMQLINHSLGKADFVSYLLQKVGTYIDPTLLVENIENGMHITALKNSLVKMMRDYNLQVTVKEGCKKIVMSDCFELHNRLVKLQQKAVLMDDEETCCVCRQRVLSTINNNNNNNTNHNLLIFYCQHVFHEECLPSIDATEKCIICYSR